MRLFSGTPSPAKLDPSPTMAAGTALTVSWPLPTPIKAKKLHAPPADGSHHVVPIMIPVSAWREEREGAGGVCHLALSNSTASARSPACTVTTTGMSCHGGGIGFVGVLACRWPVLLCYRRGWRSPASRPRPSASPARWRTAGPRPRPRRAPTARPAAPQTSAAKSPARSRGRSARTNLRVPDRSSIDKVGCLGGLVWN
jgi:hypothetical protein